LERKVAREKSQQDQETETDCNPSTSRAPRIRDSALNVINSETQQQALKMQAEQIASMEVAIAGALEKQKNKKFSRSYRTHLRLKITSHKFEHSKKSI